MNKVILTLLFLYQIIALATWGILSYWDWYATPNLISFLGCVGINAALAEIWPLYWGFFHWSF